MLMAWQLGYSQYENVMKELKNRRDCVRSFVQDTRFNKKIRIIIRDCMLEEPCKITLKEMKLLYADYLRYTKEGQRLAY
jgi:hypothetical protein